MVAQIEIDFDPDAPETARDIPLIIGTCKDEANLFSVSEPWFGTLTEAQALERFQQTLGDRAQAGLDLFRQRAPSDAPTYWYTSIADPMDFFGTLRTGNFGNYGGWSNPDFDTAAATAVSPSLE